LISSRPALPPPWEPVNPQPFTVPDEEAPGGGMSVVQILCIARAYWRHSAIAFVVLVALSFGVIKLLPKSYVSTATLMVNFENKDPLAGREFVGGGGNTYIPTQIELILSPVVLGPVVDRLKLTQDREFVRGFTGSPAALKESVVRTLRDRLQVQQGMSSQLLYISAAARNPERAAELANAVSQEYLNQERQRTNGPAQERAERYAKQLAELRTKAIAAQDRVTDFRQQNGLTEAGGQGDLEGATLADLQQKLDAAQNQRRELEAHQIDAQGSSDAVLATQSVASLRAQLAGLEAQMAESRTTLGPKHPKVVELQSQLDAVRKSLAVEVQSLSANSSVQLQHARDLENRYQTALKAERERLLGRRGLQDEEAKLVLELQSAQATYKKALDGYDQIMFASSGNYTDVNLVAAADPPPKPDKPNKMKWFAIACLFSLGCALAGPFGYELFLNRRLRCRDDFERHFKIPVLAQLSALPAVQS
jgi:uncharacterized protein involved in exopolysaccharide biosynthesis